ncbi:MAG: peptidase S8 [Flavobacterium sp. BFFFF1]|uniref:S8 family peptidase n=1 Tax=Flavobacterium sp. BFFFF1 TaxID=2015557 RepID=UPI000BCA0F45|nr:S8 family peptidase [Flavobacterium sp. BFFFF1]OYU79838.1 MAG: peptidase S8 [Flavobacterium sp. BFFFF1]
MKTLKSFWLLAFSLALALPASAQTPTKYFGKKSPLAETELQRWSHLDLVKDSVPGMSVDRAYAQLLKNKKGKPVIVGIVDSGVDIEHNDLKNVIWTNKKEIPGNGIDDDKNGYVDDIHGWNFLGNAVNENLEMTRIVRAGDDGSQTYKDAKAELDGKIKKANALKPTADMLYAAHKIVSEYLKKDNYTIDDLKSIQTTDPALNRSIRTMIGMARQSGPGFVSEVTEYRKYVYDQLDYNLNTNFDGRKVVGDDPNNIKEKSYGNNIVYGPDKEEALHGTHVAGIIAQERGNGLGGDGIANNVQIMAVRAVPNGDEYDKDIALAIRYAVDNGAKVINGSFGKSYSPHKEWVYDAIRYAEKKDVLIVHAAGNDSEDIDVESNFPNDSKDNKTEYADNVLTIGAIDVTYGDKLVADFSNYGKTNVDVFAPGVQIYATVPNNKFKFEQGTSMAAPNVAGVAALIRSYYPGLSAKQVKHIIMDSGTAIDEDVNVGTDGDKKPFSSLSKSGKIVNAYNALIMAAKLSKGKAKKLNG